MKLYNIDPRNVYPDAKVVVVPNHEDRGIIICTNHMSVYEYYPCETDGLRIDASILLAPCKGFDPETFDENDEKTRSWVEEWSYPIEMARAIVEQINHK